MVRPDSNLKSVFRAFGLICLMSSMTSLAFAQGEGGGGEAPVNNGSGSCVVDDRIANFHEAASGHAKNILSNGGLDLSALVSQWGNDRTECKYKNERAQRDCFEACSKGAQSGLSAAKAIGALMNIVSGMTNQTCGQQQQAANQMKDGNEAYSAACKASQSSCNSTCGSAASRAKEIAQKAQSACMSVTDPGKQSACTQAAKALIEVVNQDNKRDDRQTVAAKLDQCQRDFSDRLAGADQVLANLGNMLAQGKQCQDDSTDSAGADKEKSCSELSLSEQMQRQDCVCLVSPFNPGCDSSNDNSTPGFAGGEFAPIEGNQSKNIEATIPKSNSPFLNNGANGSGGGSGATGAAGYYGGSMGGDGAGQLAADSKEGEEKEKLDANILAGEGGGGGGGGGGGFWGSGMSAADANGAKVAGKGARGLASELKKDPSLTGGGGRGNFEKVKARYFDNSPTLIYSENFLKGK